MSKFNFTLMIVAVALFSSCGSSTEVAQTTEAQTQTTTVLDAESCNEIKLKSECSEFTGAAKTVATTLCTEGEHATTQCPGGFVGKCNVGKGLAKVYYAAGGKSYTAETAKADCAKMEGEFQP